ncbi:hypothetical protein A3F34_01545 [Candidatus Roizmanbacteria bacterium RIFCSPHIGHO2_12_FULL_44_10]|uniref:BrnT family toxin n=1 Tax=Candidatus Roizmanbacteria bacterium RIFCSPHIGHO2_12_FULL_44_10 TaxID=1802054 RepID=A0A1F7I6J8_9BACT|nr:MAG: hypothetical protein A3F34_01545 [Candidatus Roizmanbacteria bacterium RIFCSPHIGHO2_12_FULL_44_10]
MDFEWDGDKDIINVIKHGVSFRRAQEAFNDSKRLIFEDIRHSTKNETRYFCIGMIKDRICTVRFALRGGSIRIFGAGYWRKQVKIYEKENS